MAVKHNIDLTKVRAIWRIVFGVCNGNLDLTKEIVLWDLSNKKQPTRIGRKVISLDNFELCGGVTFEDRVAKFDNGYISFYDEPLHKQIGENFEIEWDKEGISKPDLGDSVGILAEVNFSKEFILNPIFYYPQDNEKGIYVAFSETVTNSANVRKLNWSIENNAYGSGHDYIVDDWHRLKVRQDFKHFEFLVESIPLKKQLIGKGELIDEKLNIRDYRKTIFGSQFHVQNQSYNFTFVSEERECYIGRTPDPNKPDEWVNLTGEIRSLVFDPNDSCPECRGP
jgi:hypothetical protein